MNLFHSAFLELRFMYFWSDYVENDAFACMLVMCFCNAVPLGVTLSLIVVFSICLITVSCTPTYENISCKKHC